MNNQILHNHDNDSGIISEAVLSSLKKAWGYALSFFLCVIMAGGYSPLVAAADPVWESVSTSQVTVQAANPSRNRRSTDATVAITLKNIGSTEIIGPLRLIIGGLSPAAKVSIGNATGQTSAGEPYYDLTGYVGANFAAADSGLVNVIVTGGGPNIFSFTPRVERQLAQVQALTVKITSPATLLTVGSTPQTVKGTVSDPNAQVTLNGTPVTNSNGSFQADVALDEGHNTISARAVNAKGEDVTDVISLSLDMTPPYITVESPKNGDIVRVNKIAVSGLINDIVRGTVAEGQANVKVNGTVATVANRSYLAENISLNEGDNTIKIDASDNVGNTSTLSIKVTYQPLAAQHIELLSGQDQNAKIGTVLTQPLKVKLLDGAGQPVANKPVIYRVTEGDGVVGAGSADQGQGVLVQTDATGLAATSFKLGSRAGTGNQRVRAASVGFDGEVLFYASANVGTGAKVTVNSGNNQRGGISQPLPQPLVVAVVDEGANVVPGAQIEFKVTQGSGKFQNGETSISSTTDSDGRATAEFTLGSEEGLDVHRATATLAGTTLYAGFTASALKTGDPGQTSISGVVLDNQEHPLPKVTVRVDGTTREAQTDDKGQFKITEAPVGSLHLIADGSTTTAEGEWPTLAFNIVTIAGADNPLSAPIYLVKLDTVNAKQVGDKDVTLTLPDVPGFALEVKAGSVTFPDGKKTGQLSVTPVNASKIPMAPPNGMQPQFIVTIQPVGAKFDPPAKLTLPNVDGHAPGAQVEMYSYDHDLEEFVSIGLGTASADGSVIKSNDGVGVIKAGWHCGSQPGGSGCANGCPVCKDCDGNCNCVAKDGDPRLKECQKCDNGKAVTIELTDATAKVNGKDEDVVVFQKSGTTVSFTGSATGKNCDFQYEWDFGDGSTKDTTQSPSHKYTKSGEYNAILKVKCKNCNVEKTNTVKVTAVEILDVTSTAADIPAVGNKDIKHFVTAQGSGDVTLNATINPNTSLAKDAITWSGAAQDSSDKLKATVAKSAAIKKEVKVQVGGQDAKELRVWVVWTNLTGSVATPVITTKSSPSGFIVGTHIESNFSSTAIIQPATIITDTDRPELSGVKTSGPPGGKNSCGSPLSGGADNHWDISRRITIRATTSATSPPLTLNCVDNTDTYPSVSEVGNDDAGTGDETNDPYNNSGSITSIDTPSREETLMGGVVGDTYNTKLWFQEFARLELGSSWVVISSPLKWRVDYKFKKFAVTESLWNKDVNGDGDKLDTVTEAMLNQDTNGDGDKNDIVGYWGDDASVSANDNANLPP